MSKTFFIADLHFGHDRIIGFENRPFKDSKEMNGAIISNWNKVVSVEDRVFILGDFAIALDSNKDKIKNWVKSLNGYKIFILGNHDRDLPYSFWLEAGFHEVSAYPIIYKDFFVLSHEPIYLNSNMPYANIFGHVHGNPQFKDFSAQSFCVSVERINYTPIEFDKIIEKINEGALN